MKTLIEVNAGYDRNGNPRSGFIVTWLDNMFIRDLGMGFYHLYEKLGIHWAEQADERTELWENLNYIQLTVTPEQFDSIKRAGV